MFLQLRWPNQQCQSTERGWLVIQIALNLTRLISPCYNNTTCMHIQDNDTQRNLSTVSEASEMKQMVMMLMNLCHQVVVHQLTRCCPAGQCWDQCPAGQCWDQWLSVLAVMMMTEVAESGQSSTVSVMRCCHVTPAACAALNTDHRPHNTHTGFPLFCLRQK